MPSNTCPIQYSVYGYKAIVPIRQASLTYLVARVLIHIAIFSIQVAQRTEQEYRKEYMCSTEISGMDCCSAGVKPVAKSRGRWWSGWAADNGLIQEQAKVQDK